MSGVLQTAYQSVIDACADPFIGYSQSKRTTIKLGGSSNTYCDCSSLLSWALTRAGYFKTNPWFYTGNEQAKLISANWAEFNAGSVIWQPGDILWRSGHTEMVYVGDTTTGRGRTMGAHSSSYAFAKQVSINSGYTSASGAGWTYLYRDSSGGNVGSADWHQSSTGIPSDLTSAEVYDNAICIYNYFSAAGWTDEAIAGLLGNMQQESGLDPYCWQNGIPGTVNTGYGLVQWTPSTNYTSWASLEGYSLTDAEENGTGQCIWLETETVSSGQWIATSSYNYTFSQFTQLTNVRTATDAFCYCFERPGTPAIANRRSYANYWYTEITNNFPSDSGGGGNEPALPNVISDLQRRLIIPGRH